jgi:hypothetical protein
MPGVGCPWTEVRAEWPAATKSPFVDCAVPWRGRKRPLTLPVGIRRYAVAIQALEGEAV